MAAGEAADGVAVVGVIVGGVAGGGAIADGGVAEGGIAGGGALEDMDAVGLPLSLTSSLIKRPSGHALLWRVSASALVPD